MRKSGAVIWKGLTIDGFRNSAEEHARAEVVGSIGSCDLTSSPPTIDAKNASWFMRPRQHIQRSRISMASDAVARSDPLATERSAGSGRRRPRPRFLSGCRAGAKEYRNARSRAARITYFRQRADPDEILPDGAPDATRDRTEIRMRALRSIRKSRARSCGSIERGSASARRHRMGFGGRSRACLLSGFRYSSVRSRTG